MARRFGVRMAAPVGWMLGCGWLVSCSAIFGIDPADRRDEAELGGAGGDDPSRGGRSTGGRSTGGRSTGGDPSGGRAGSGGDGGGSAVGNQAGTAGQTLGGAGGDGGDEARGATLGEPCTGDETQTNSACTTGSPHLILACDEGVWKVETTCDGDAACVPENGGEPAQCLKVAEPCKASYWSVCDGGNRLIDCESHRPDWYARYCPFGCQNGACVPGVGDQLTVHTGTGTGPWSRSRTIPVCVLDASKSDGKLVDWIRDEVERTWARTTNYNFEGWGACDETLPNPGVVLSFESACRGHLGNDIDSVSALVRLQICRSLYFEGDEPGIDEPTSVEEPLARFLARHYFGHVIGIPDWSAQVNSTTAMARGIELSRVTEYEISFNELYLADLYCAPYCRKHPGAIVTHRGRCLEVVDGSIVATACADHGAPGPQDFTLRMSELFTADPERCVGVSVEGQETQVLAGDCTAMSERFAFTGAALRSLGRCALPATFPASPGTALGIGACDAVPEGWTGWSFDVTAANPEGLVARIRHDDLCVSVPGGVAALNLVPELRPCGEGREQIFDLTHDGRIRFDDRCFGRDMQDGSVYLTICDAGASDRWTVTGAFTTPSGWTLTLADGDSRAAAKPKAASDEAQMFDVYF